MKYKLLAIALSAFLTACGGGGGGTATGSASGTAAPGTPVAGATDNAAGTLLTSIPAATYAADSTEGSMFAMLNTLRKDGGFGMLPQNALLDKAAANHANYINLNYLDANGLEISSLGEVQPNGLLKAHTEASTGLGFTGITPTDRANAAGYSGRSVGELQSGYNVIYPSSKTDAELKQLAAISCVESWLRSNHHRSGLLNTAYVEIGVGNATSKSYVYGPTNTLRFMGCVLNPSAGLDTKSRGVAPNGWTGVYPLDNATGINPLGLVGTLDGMAASIHFESTSSMSIASFTLKKVSDGAMVIGTVDNTIDKAQAYFIPTAKLEALTQYEANFQGSEVTSMVGRSSRNVSKVWRFTTR